MEQSYYLNLSSLTLRLDITIVENGPDTMVTHYVKSSDNFPFDKKLFDNVTWTGSKFYEY